MIKHITKQMLLTKEWSGGTTTELYIFPEDSNYESLDFDFRMSTATVEEASSTFTTLPGINRLIMSLDGPLELHHENHHEIKLTPFEVDRFKGDWQTTSKGKVTDFNLMFKDGLNAEMIVMSSEITIGVIEGFTAIYAFEGTVLVKKSNQNFILDKGDLLVISDEEDIRIKSNGTRYVWVTL